MSLNYVSTVDELDHCLVEQQVLPDHKAIAAILYWREQR
jgi:hypothetical protein